MMCTGLIKQLLGEHNPLIFPRNVHVVSEHRNKHQLCVVPWLTTLSVDDALLSPWKTYDRDQNHNVLVGSHASKGLCSLQTNPCTVIIDDCCVEVTYTRNINDFVPLTWQLVMYCISYNQMPNSCM